MGSFSIWHWIIVLLIVLLLFGAGKLPTVMGDIAKGIKAFKAGLKDPDEEDSPPPAPPAVTPAPSPTVAQTAATPPAPAATPEAAVAQTGEPAKTPPGPTPGTPHQG